MQRKSHALALAASVPQALAARRTWPEWARRGPRFVLVSVAAGGVQLGLLALLLWRGWLPLPANLLAFALATQVSYTLSAAFTWRGRPSSARGLARWLRYNGAIASTAVANQLLFLGLNLLAPTLLASLLASAAMALVNFNLINRFVFTPSARVHGA